MANSTGKAGTEGTGGVGKAGTGTGTGGGAKAGTGTRANTLVTLLTHLQHSLDTVENRALRNGVAGAYSVETRVDVAHLRGRRDMVKELLASGALVESQAGLQVLFMLPASFVRAYAGLFERALREAGGAVSGKGIEHDRGSGRAPGKQGMALGSETALQAQGGGKKWKEPQLPISTELQDFKTAMDRELLELSGRIATRLERRGAKSSGAKSAGSGAESRSEGICPGVGCKRFTKSNWKFCPNCGTQLRSAVG